MDSISDDNDSKPTVRFTDKVSLKLVHTKYVQMLGYQYCFVVLYYFYFQRYFVGRWNCL